MNVIAQGERGTIVGSKNGYLRIRIDGQKNIFSYHPTDDMKYLSNGEEGIKSSETGMIAQATQPSAHIISTIGDTTCDVCGRPMYDDNGREYIALAIGVSNHPEADRVKEVFGKQSFNVCFVCFLRVLGVKELKVEEKIDG